MQPDRLAGVPGLERVWEAGVEQRRTRFAHQPLQREDTDPWLQTGLRRRRVAGESRDKTMLLSVKLSSKATMLQRPCVIFSFPHYLKSFFFLF